MSIKTFQRSRIGAALRSILRAATGRNPSDDEISGRVAAYLSAPLTRGLGPGDTTPTAMPLFNAADYAPIAETDPLGGADGRDISRAWAALIEDYGTVDDILTEAERRMAASLSLIRNQGTSLSSQASALSLDADAIQSQAQQLFFGGSGGATSAGRGRSVWNNNAADGIQVAQTTGVVLASGLGIMPTQGQTDGTDGGGSLAAPTLLSASDPTLLSSTDARAFLEQPLASSSAWAFQSSTATPSLTFSLGGSSPIGALEIAASTGVTVTGLFQGTSALPYQTLQTAGTVWVIPATPFPVATALTLTLGAVASSTGAATGSISSVKAHVFSFDPTGTFVWGPFTRLSTDGLFSVTLDTLTSATSTGASIDMQISTVSADGPWSDLPDLGTPLVLSASGNSVADLLASDSQPDSLSQGFYRFPFAQSGSLVGASFTAGTDQAKAEAYYFDWSSVGEVAHDVQPSDWTTPQGTPRVVALGAGPTYRGDTPAQAFAITEYQDEGTCLGRYRDMRGVEATFIALRDGANTQILQPGYNYRFSFGIYTVGASYLSDIPIGIFNPNGAAGVYALPLLVELNGQQVYRTAQTFQDFNELSDAPDDYGSSVSDYTTGAGSRSYQGAGASWPQNCGRMNLALTPGWNTLCVSLYVPIGNTSIDANLAAGAGIVFGPSLFQDGDALYALTGIQEVRGWSDPWTQLSEFDLRTNTPLGLTNVWAWVVDPTSGTIQAVLINHNPSYSETGYPTLDGNITGQPRTHRLSYLPAVTTASSPVPGQDAQSSSLWVRAQLSSSSPNAGPFVQGFGLSAN
jgi:hypothetical protein